MPTFPVTLWFSTLGIGDGQDMATRGYLRALMAINYQHLVISPRGTPIDHLDKPDLEPFRAILGYPEKFQPEIKRVEKGDPRIGTKWEHLEPMTVPPPPHAPADSATVSWDAIVQEGEVDQDYYREHPEELHSEWTPKTEVLVAHYDPGQLARARDALAREMGGETPVVGITAWEPDRLPMALAQQLSDLDVLVVPSKHTAAAFKRSGFDPDCPIRVVPHALLMDPLSEQESAHAANSSSNKYTFYTIGSNIERKNLRGLIAAYCRAFAPRFEGVGLVIKTSGDAQNMKKLYQEGVELGACRGWPRIALEYRERWSDERIRQLHYSCNCWVDATRGEGFGLTQLDAAAMGNPVITTGWGAQTEVLDIPGVMRTLIDYELVSVPAEMAKIGAYQEDQQWAEPNIDVLADSMRQVAMDRWSKSRAQALKVADVYSFESVGRKLVSAFQLAKEG